MSSLSLPRQILNVLRRKSCLLLLSAFALIFLSFRFLYQRQLSPMYSLKESNQSNSSPKILCFVLTCPEYHNLCAIRVKKTWGRRCDKLLFMSTEEDKELGAVNLKNIEEEPDWLWAKTMASLEYIWAHHGDEYDWFLKADDDTFVVMENLRAFLKHCNTAEPVFYGHRLISHRRKPGVSMFVRFAHGGSGYVLSREALRRFIQRNNETRTGGKQSCWEGHNYFEDKEIALCMEKLGVQLKDPRDSEQRYRFTPYPLEWYVAPNGLPLWYQNSSLVKPRASGSSNYCSPSAISFHYILPNMMNAFDYLIYSVRRSEGLR